MAIPVGVILHSFSKLIHPAYGHAAQGGGLAPGPWDSTLTGQGTVSKMLVPSHTQDPKPLAGIFHLHKCSCVSGKRTHRCSLAGFIQHQRLGHGFHEAGGSGAGDSLAWAIKMRAEEQFILI